MSEAINSHQVSLKEKLIIFFDDGKEIDLRLKAAQEFADAFEYSSQNSDYPEVLKELYERSQKFLIQNEPQFLQENPLQQLRKQCLELFQKVPNNEHNKQYSKLFMNVLMKLVEYENEENTMICVKLLVDIHKSQRPNFSNEVINFLKFVRNVYKELQNHTNKIFTHSPFYEIDSIEDFPLETKVLETFTVTKIHTKQKDMNDNKIDFNILPKSCYSLKVMQEIPVLLVLMYQFHKSYITNEIASFIPLIMEFLNLVPSENQKKDEHFNEALYLDFLAAQVKTLSFLAYVVKFFKKPLMEKYADSLVQGMYRMIVNIPSHVTNMRKEYFIAARHILGTQEIKPRFVKVLSDLMNEDILIGNGYTVNQLLRPLSYSTLADLIHYVKSELNLAKIAKATNMYIKNMHDDTLVFSIQQMSMKLLLNFIEPIKNKITQNPQEINEGHQILIKILYALVKRLGTISKYYLPKLEKGCLVETNEKQQSNEDMEIKVKVEESVEEDKLKLPSLPKIDEKPIKPEHNLVLPILTLQDLKILTKHLIHGIKTITLTLTSSNKLGSSTTPSTTRQESVPNTMPNFEIQSHKEKFLEGFDVKIYCKLIRYCLRMMDLYLIYYKDGQLYQRPPSTALNAKFIDEKSILEIIAVIFLHLSPANFKEVFQTQIKFIIERANVNSCILQLFQIILSSSQEEYPTNSAILANLILSYLLDNMEIIGEGTPEASLHTRLFKQIFNSVHTNLVCFENVLEVHLKRIVLGCMKYALSAKDPSSFMCLLRYLFRSIGGGAHERLYREFLPLLPLMLTGLSSLLRSPHTNQVRDLLGELCVIVPVRLSTLLPHLSLLMEPLVHVLSCNTISQGLRTLELCVDNMSPEYLYQNMYPVRGDIMFAMLQSFRCKSEQVNRTAFKVLGKMGRYNRCDLLESQQIQYDSWQNQPGPEMNIRFTEFPDDFVTIPVKDIVFTAVQFLKSEKVELQTKEKTERVNKAWLFLKSFIVKVVDELGSNVGIELFNVSKFREIPMRSRIEVEPGEYQWIGLQYDNPTNTEAKQIFDDNMFIPRPHEPINLIDTDLIFLSEVKEYEIAKSALIGLFIGCLHEQIRRNNMDFIIYLVQQLTISSLAELCKYASHETVDFNDSEKVSYFSVTRLLVDSITETMAYEDKDCIRLGTMCIERMNAIIFSASESKMTASNLPIYNLFSQRIIQLLHRTAWYSRWGGCAMLIIFIRELHPCWLWGHLLDFLKGLFYTITDLNLQICQGALTMAKNCLEMLIECSLNEIGRLAVLESATNDEERIQINNIYEKLVASVCQYVIRILLSENDCVREKASAILQQLSKLTNRNLNTLLQPHLHIVSEILPPTPTVFKAYPLSKQIAILEINYLFGNHVNCGNCVHYAMEIDNHEKFINEIRNILETSSGSDDDLNTSVPVGGSIGSSTSLAGSSQGASGSTSNANTNRTTNLCSNSNQQQCTVRQACAYTDMSTAVALKVAACKLLSTLWYLDTEKDRNFQALFKAMCSKDVEVHETAFKCLQEFLSHTNVSLELRNANLKPLLTTFRENYTLATNRQLYYCARLFHASFSERMCESLLVTKVKPVLDILYERFEKNGFIDTENDEKFLLLIKTVELFHVLHAASNKYVQSLTELVLKVEQKIFCYSTSQLRKPLIMYLSKCPVETVKLFLQTTGFSDDFYANNFFIDCLNLKEAKPIRDYLQNQVELLIDLLNRKSHNDLQGNTREYLDEMPNNLTNYNVHHFVIKIIHKLAKWNLTWWLNSKRLVDALNKYWCSVDFQNRLMRFDKIHYSHWTDIETILNLLMCYIDHYLEAYEFLFSVARAFKIRALGSLHKLRQFLTDLFIKRDHVWKQNLFRHYINQAHNKIYSPDILYVIFANIILPAFSAALETISLPSEKEDLFGGPPKPNEDADDIVTVFLNKLIDSQECGDGGLRVAYCQFCILILEYAPNYIHEISNKKQGHKARIILTFAWPSVTNQPQFTDLLEKYVGLQTIAYLISKFNINRKIIVRVFTCLAKGNCVEPKKVINAALGVLVPAWLQRKDDLNFLVLHTKKVSMDDVTSQSQLHIGNLIVRHSDIYYQARMHILPLMQYFISRLSNQNFQPEQRRCLLDMIELILRWDIKAKEESISGTSSVIIHDKTISDQQKESLANLIVRLMVQILDQSQTNSANVDASCRRALFLLETAFHPLVWGPINLNIESMSRYFKIDLNVTTTVLNPQINTQFNNMVLCLDLLTTFFKLMDANNILQNMKSFSKPLCDILNNPKVAQSRFIKFFGFVLKALLLRFPAEPSNKQKITQNVELMDLYNTVLKFIQEAFSSYEQKPSSPNSNRVQSALYLLNMTQQVKQNSYAFVDRCLMHLVNMAHKLVSEIIKTNSQSEEVEQLIGAIEIIKSRFNVLGADMRRTKVIRIFVDAICVVKDAKLLRIVMMALRNWMKLPKQEEHFAPGIREKSELFVRLWAKYHSWSENSEIQKEILSVLLLVFENEQLQIDDTNNTFQTAFCTGMVSPWTEVREKYLEFYLEPIRRINLLERFLFLISANEWDSRYFKLVNWIPTFLEVLLLDIKLDDDFIINFKSFMPIINCKMEEEQPMDFVSTTNMSFFNASFANMSFKNNDGIQHHLLDMKTGSVVDRVYKNSIYNYFTIQYDKNNVSSLPLDIENILFQHNQIWNKIKKVQVGDVLSSIQLMAYNSYKLSNTIFQHLFPQLWNIFLNKYPDMWPILKQEMIHFLSNPSHNQHIGQSAPNPMTCFLEAVSKIPNFFNWFQDSTFVFLASSHNLWFLGIMVMEDCLYRFNQPDKYIYSGFFDSSLDKDDNLKMSHDGIESNGIIYQPDFFLSLNCLYELLEEEDYQFGLWSEKCSLLTPEMQQSIAFAQQSQYDKALKISVEAGGQSLSSSVEYKDIVMRQKFYDFNYRYLKKLGQWDILDKFLNGENVNYLIKAESLWRKGQWKDVIQNHKLNQNSVQEIDKWRAQLIYCYSLIMNKISMPNNEDTSNAPQLDNEFNKVTAFVLQQWKSLPNNCIITPRHVSMLQACNLAVEGWDGMQLFSGIHNNNVLSEVKSMIKSWKNRFPHHSDSFSFCSDIVLWRRAVFDKLIHITASTATDSSRVYRNEIYLLLLELVRNGRKQHLSSCTKNYADKLKQQLPEMVSNSFSLYKQECKVKMFEEGWRHSYVESLEMLENVDAQRFKDKRDLAKFYCYKAMLFSHFNKGDEATRHFGYALQIDAYNNKIWSIYADFLENVFSNYPVERRQRASQTTGIFAITALVEAASALKASGSTASSHLRDDKVCSNLAKCLWLVTIDDNQLRMSGHLEEISNKLPASVLLPWARSIITCLLRPEGKHMVPMLIRLANEFPEAIYQPFRCLKNKLNKEYLFSDSSDNNASDGMKLYENVLNQMRKNNGSKLYLVDEFCQQLEWLCPSWSEQLLAQIISITNRLNDYIHEVLMSNCPFSSDERLPDCFLIELHHLGMLLDFSTDASMDIDNEDPCSNINRLWSIWLSMTNNDVVTARYHAYLNSRYCQDIRVRFSNDFGNSKELYIMPTLNKLKKVWIPLLKRIVNLQAKSNYLDERTRLLTEIAQSSCDLSLPGDLSVIKRKEHHLHIASISPLIERIWNNGQFCRRIKIRASNGHNFEYYIHSSLVDLQSLVIDSKNDGCAIYKFWMQEKLFQIFRVLNESFNKERESYRRGLNLHSPRLMEVNCRGTHLREVGCGMNPILQKDVDLETCRIVSLEDIWHWYCIRKIDSLQCKLKKTYINQNQMKEKDDEQNLLNIEIMTDPEKAMLKYMNEEKSRNNFPMNKKILNCAQRLLLHTNDEALIKFARLFCSGSEDYWMLRKQLTNDFAVLNMIQYLMQISSLRPSQYIIDLRKATLQIISPQLHLSEDARLENLSNLPFRLSPNIVKFLQPSGQSESLWKTTSQPYTASMIATGHVLYWCRNNLLALIRALLRDYFVLWHKYLINSYENKEMYPIELENCILEKWLSSAIEQIQYRISNVGRVDDDAIIREKIQSSLDPLNQALMKPSYQSWI